MRRLPGWLGWALFGLPSAIAGLWLLVFDAPRLALAFLLLAAVLLPVGASRPRARFAAVALLLGVSVLLRPVFAEELGDWLDHLAQQKDRDGARAFSFRDQIGVYGLNLVMGFGGYLAGYPEVADETISLAWPGAQVRTWASSFAMRSPQVREAVRKMVKGLPAADTAAIILPAQSVSWSSYGFSEDLLRVALAVNCPFLIEGTGRREIDAKGSYGPWILELKGTARIAYPRRGFLPLGVRGNGKPWGLDEGLFWVLEERGWLQPYTAVWRWSLRADDQFLGDVTTVQRSWREQLFRVAWRVVE